MKAEELRIGNFIEQGKVFEVKPYHVRVSYWHQHKQQDAMSLVKLDECEPIPLSEELKVKLHGIENNGIAFDDKHIILFSATNQEMWFRLEDYPYLHQVQNLYYALVGEELEVKL